MQYLYRAYNSEEKLLYVGISGKWSERLHQHERESAWMELTDYVTIERFPDRESVEAAEKRAIQTEDPEYNKAHKQFYESTQDHFQQVKLWLRTGREDERHSALLSRMREFFLDDLELSKKRSQDVAWALQEAYSYLRRENGIDCRNCEAIFRHGMYQRWASATDMELDERGYYDN